MAYGDKIVFDPRSRAPERWLSNSEHAPMRTLIHEQMVMVFTVEHAIQMARCAWPDDAFAILNVPTPEEAQDYGRTVEVNPLWEEHKLTYMSRFLHDKFTQHRGLHEYLISTAGYTLEFYDGREHISYWGMGRIGGQNMLGRLLMQLRDQLCAQAQSQVS